MYNRILDIPLKRKKSFFLLGPRGTGKTHFLKHKLPDPICIDLLNSDQYQKLLGNPYRITSYIPLDFKGWVVIDEIQRVPALLNEVHRLIEEKGYRFAMTGSSARKLRRGGTNLLAGRALLYHMHPFTIQELGDHFDLKKALLYGLLPAAIEEEDPKAFLKTYVQTYLREEVAQEGLTRNLGNFAHFLEIASFSQGQVLNKSNVARETHAKERTVSNYFTILEDLLLGYMLPVFNKRAKRKTIVHPKFYFFDTGVYQALRPRGPLDRPEEISGLALETLFFQSLKAINEIFDFNYKIYYWRTVSGIEVDFILYGASGILAFEVKLSADIAKQDLKGLIAFQKEYPMAKAHIIYGGDKKRYFGNITVWPVKEILQALPDVLRG